MYLIIRFHHSQRIFIVIQYAFILYRHFSISCTLLFIKHVHILLNHNLSSVFFFFAVLKGFVQRRKFKRLLANKRQQDAFVKTFLQGIETSALSVFGVLQSCQLHDESNITTESVQTRDNLAGSPRRQDIRFRFYNLHFYGFSFLYDKMIRLTCGFGELASIFLT